MSMHFRPTLLRFDSLASTNTEAARQAARGALEGLCVVAREQTAGRGRLGRGWLSPAGAGLYFSIVLRPRLEAGAWPLISLMAALAARDALATVCEINVDIKWPNDILARERKLCGILAETVETQTGRGVVVGIGINLNDEAFPPELRDVATSVKALTGTEPDAERLLHLLVRALQERYATLQATGGIERTLDEWSARSSYAVGKRVRVRLSDETLEGITRGLERDGALRVETEAGEINIVRAGDVIALRTR
jgi:BirA family biotin operon repressor/biotin-[acetyl-CoA-carboxylase] ligase